MPCYSARRAPKLALTGWTPTIWDEDDYAIVDEVKVGRIYQQRIHGELRWVWCLQTNPAPPPNRGIADTLDEAKAAFKQRYEEVKKAR